jgi:hypothetical protein
VTYPAGVLLLSSGGRVELLLCEGIEGVMAPVAGQTHQALQGQVVVRGLFDWTFQI